MSQTSASEPPILAKQLGVSVEHLEEEIDIAEHDKPNTHEVLVKRSHRNVLNASTVTETSDHSSSVLWTPAQALAKPQKQRSSHRSHRKSHKSKRRLYKDEKRTESEETSTFLSKQEQEKSRIKSEKLCSFEREHKEQHRKKSRNSMERNSSRRSGKKHLELCNDYTRYQYHRRSNKDKHRKHKSRSKENYHTELSNPSGLPKIIKRIKDFFFGKRTSEEEQRHKKKPPKEHHLRQEFQAHMLKKREISGKLFRSASDSDLEVVKHRHRRSLHKKQVKDDFQKSGRHWKSKHHHHHHHHHDNKLSSIYESSDRSAGRLGSGSDGGKLVLARSGRTTYNDVSGYKNGDVRRGNGHVKKEEASEESHSMESGHSRRRHRRRNKEYQSLKKKWAKQNQSFENDLEKLEKLVELIGMKKTQVWMEEKSSENTSLLERLEATQEKCVAEVDFTRHVLICKLQRLENKLEESLTSVDCNNNSSDDKGRIIEEIREDMSKECRDLRRLLQETSNQLKQVLDEKTPEANEENNEGSQTPIQKRLGRHSRSANDILNNKDVPFPELSHHPLNKRISRNCESEPTPQNKTQQHGRVTTYV